MAALSSISRPQLVTASADVDGEIICATFNRNAVTLRWLAEAHRADSEQDAFAVAATLASVITSWDITQEDGSPYPPTAENIADLPASVLATVMSAIENESAPSRAEGNDSSELRSTLPSGSVEQAQTHQNGAATSPSPSDSAALSPR